MTIFFQYCGICYLLREQSLFFIYYWGGWKILGGGVKKIMFLNWGGGQSCSYKFIGSVGPDCFVCSSCQCIFYCIENHFSGDSSKANHKESSQNAGIICMIKGGEHLITKAITTKLTRQVKGLKLGCTFSLFRGFSIW